MSKIFSELLTLYCGLIAIEDAEEANKTRSYYAHAFGKENAEFMKNMKELTIAEYEAEKAKETCKWSNNHDLINGLLRNPHFEDRFFPFDVEFITIDDLAKYPFCPCGKRIEVVND